MVWKSNLEENEQEFIEDFGAKMGNDIAVPKQAASKPPAARRNTTAKKNSSPAKSLNLTQQVSGGDFNHDFVVAEPGGEHGVGGTGEELQ